MYRHSSIINYTTDPMINGLNHDAQLLTENKINMQNQIIT